ncbi:MAG: hypothetical protein AAF600_20285 [Bacteroidota bacterium]
MEKKYQSLTLFQFQQQFPDDQACYDHLAQLKWPDGSFVKNVNTPTIARESRGGPISVPNVAIKPLPPTTHFFIK